MIDPMGLVTYLDFGPSFAATAIKKLPGWAALIRSEDGAAEATLLVEANRPERFALIETWSDPAKLNAYQASGGRLEPPTASGLSAPPDARIGQPFSVGTTRPAGPEALYILVHVDVAPFDLTAAGHWLRAQAEAARLAPGALRYEVWCQVDRPNHFTAIQAWIDHAAYTDHVESAATCAYRANLLSMRGALYDERHYRRVD